MTSSSSLPQPLSGQPSYWKQPATWLGAFVYLGFCLYVFRDFLLQGGNTIAFIGGDPLKNLFTYLYSAAYDGGSLWFTGMNYPFGEHLSFADAQPALTIPVAWLQKGLHLSQPHLLLIMYWAVALSFVVAMIYTQRILSWFGVPAAFAIVLSALIVIMSPHTFRYLGHFPLAYASFLPMLFYWSVRYYETNRKGFLIKILLLILIYAFLHLYFLGMALVWAGAYALGAALFRRNKPGTPLGHSLWYMIPVVSAFVITKLFFFVTDPITDRPGLPYVGGYEQGEGLNLLTSIFSPIWVAAKDVGLINHLREWNGEFCYLGLVPVGMLVTFGIFCATGFWKKISIGQRHFEWQWLFIVGLTLLFSLTIKHFWEVGIFNKLLEPLRQFRSPERFVWIAYYLLSILAVIVLYRICHYWWARGRKGAAGILGLLVTAIWAIDANGAILFFHRSNKNAHWNGEFLFSKEASWKAHLAQRGYQPRQFSSILALPLVHVGSEKIWLNEYNSYSTTPAFKGALEMHLPLIDVYMSRTSWSQTFETVRLAGGYFADQSLLGRIAGDGRAILISRLLEPSLTPDETTLLQSDVADSLGQVDGCGLYAFWPQKYLRRQAGEVQKAKALAGFMKSSDTVVGNGLLPYYLNHFEAANAPGAAFAGSSGNPAIKSEDSVLGELVFPQALAQPENYELSIWTKFPTNVFRSNYYQIKCFDGEGKELSITDALGKYSTDNAPGLWFRVSTYFEVPAGTARIKLTVLNPNLESYLALDEVLLRPTAATVISRLPNGQIMVNNHRLPR